MKSTILSYRDLIVWQKAIELTILIYELTRQFPNTEQFGLTSQMQRASVSITSNIAEGKNRATRKDFAKFLRIAYASGAELETQIIIAKQLDLGNASSYTKIEDVLNQIMKILNVMIRKMSSKAKT